MQVFSSLDNALSMENVDTSLFPKHLAIIPDGNRRWAQKRGCSVREGHEAGADNMLKIVRAAHNWGVKEMIFYVFSTENWNRHSLEVRTLLFLFRSYLLRMRQEMLEEGVSFHTIGKISALPASLVNIVRETEQATASGEKMKLILAFNYGGRDEICRAIQKILDDHSRGKVEQNEITESLIAQYMDTAPFSDPELIIRTSGEQRLSNFLLWQASYAEFYSSPVYWPDFTTEDLLMALREYQRRERRLGGI